MMPLWQQHRTPLRGGLDADHEGDSSAYPASRTRNSRVSEEPESQPLAPYELRWVVEQRPPNRDSQEKAHGRTQGTECEEEETGPDEPSSNRRELKHSATGSGPPRSY